MNSFFLFLKVLLHFWLVYIISNILLSFVPLSVKCLFSLFGLTIFPFNIGFQKFDTLYALV